MPLSCVATNGARCVKILFEKDGVHSNSRDKYNGWAPLLWSVVNGHEAVMKLLLAMDGVNPESKDTDG
jgi:ankyrin repeat protein